MLDFLRLKDEDILIFEDNLLIAKDTISQAVLSYSDNHINFCDYIALMENILNPIQYMLNKYNYLSGIDTSIDIYKNMTIMYNDKIDFLINENVYKLLNGSITKNEDEIFYKNFLLNKFKEKGVGLSKEQKKKLKVIDDEIIELEYKYVKNISESSKQATLFITNEEFKDNHNILSSMAKYNEEKNCYEVKYSITNFNIIQTLCQDEVIRMRVDDERHKVGKIAPYNNEKIAIRIIELCQNKANILGFDSFADFQISKNMGENYKNVLNFLNDFNNGITSKLNSEKNEVYKIAKLNGCKGKIPSYSINYYINLLRQNKFSYKNENNKVVKLISGCEEKYFKTIEESIPIIANFVSEIFGLDLNYDQKKNILNVSIDNRLVANIVLDLYEKENKKSGAWASVIIPTRKVLNFGKQDPLTDKDIFKREKEKIGLFGLTTNFDKNRPLNFSKLKTILHELGHCLHYASSQVNYEELSGTISIARDAVEIPSMMLEKFYLNKDLLKKLTNNQIPNGLIDTMKNQNSFMIADFYSRRLIAPALLDIKIFSDRSILENKESIIDITTEIFNKNTAFGISENNNLILNFTHLFGGRYKAGYYGYVWADVYAIDAYMHITKDHSNGLLFREKFMSKGSSDLAQNLYDNFKSGGVNLQTVCDFYDIEKTDEKLKNKKVVP